MTLNIYSSTAFTFISALIWAIFGYLSRQPEEKFEPQKLFSTIVSAIIVAIIVVAFKLEPQTAEELTFTFLFQTTAIIYIERIFKTMWRRWLKELIDPWISEPEE